MVVLSLRHHMERKHRTVLPQTQGVDFGGGGQETYVLSFQRVLKSVTGPINRFLARVNIPGILREKFIYWHWKLKVEIIHE